MSAAPSAALETRRSSARQRRWCPLVTATKLGIVIALHAIRSGLLLVSGLHGGEMVYRHHFAVIPENASVAQDEARRHLEGTYVR